MQEEEKAKEEEERREEGKRMQRISFDDDYYTSFRLCNVVFASVGFHYILSLLSPTFTVRYTSTGMSPVNSICTHLYLSYSIDKWLIYDVQLGTKRPV